MAADLLNRQDAIAIASRFLDGMAKMDFAAVAGLMSEDVVVSMPFAPGGEQPLQGSDRFRETMASTVPLFLAKIAFTIDAASFDPETQRVVLEYHSEGERADGRPYGNRYVGIWDLRDTKICRWMEYYNPAQLA